MFLFDLNICLHVFQKKCQPAVEADATRGLDHDPRVTQDATHAQGIVVCTLKEA